MTQRDSFRYVDQLQSIVDGYNNTPSRITKMTPVEALLPKNQHIVYENLQKVIAKKALKKQKPIFKVGDWVLKKLRSTQGPLDKGYKKQFDRSPYQIAQIVPGTRVAAMYRIRNSEGTLLKNNVYQAALQRGNPPTPTAI